VETIGGKQGEGGLGVASGEAYGAAGKSHPGNGHRRHASSPGDWSEQADEIFGAVVSHLRASFRDSLNEHDLEDLAQDALAEIHRRALSGEEIHEPKAFAKRVAWRDARDLLQQRRTVPSDPQGRLLQAAEDPGHDPEARLIGRAELARAIEAAERLTPEQQAVYRSKFFEQLKPRETCKRLGLARQTYYSRLNAAVSAVEESLEPGRFAELARELLRGYLAGTSTPAERRRARRLMAADPTVAALARELRDLHQGAAAVLPVPVIDRAGDASLIDRALNALGALRDRLVGLGGDHGGEQLAGRLQSGGAGRGVGAAGTGLVAQLGLAGGAGKLALSCFVTGAAITACVAAGVLPAPRVPGLGGDDEPTAIAGRSRHPLGGRLPAPNPDLVTPAPKAGQFDRTPVSRTPKTDGSASGAGEQSSTSPSLEPSTPPVEQEFGVAAAAPSPSPANAPGGAASQKDVQREFGP
jgi:RNA polymerase sigma factor (sigma-70 family)